MINIIDEDMDCILRKAFEDGLRYWCHGVDCGERPGMMDLSTWVTLLITGGDRSHLHPRFQVPVTVQVLDSEGKPHHLNQEGILRGLTEMIQGQDSRQDYIYEQGLECDHIDANLADEIVQYALFGKLRYCPPLTE